MIYRKFFFGYVLHPVNDIPLPELPAGALLQYDIPKIPIELLGQAWSFFRTIYNRLRTEAMLDITWHPDKGYRLFVPHQTVTAMSVDAKRKAEHYANGGMVVGTIHSHCDFGAFHSGTDTHDAGEHDGLHITIGKNLSDPPELAIMISANKKNWDFKLEDIADGELKLVEHPKWWEEYVKTPAPRPPTANTKKNQHSQKNHTTSIIPWKPSSHPTRPNETPIPTWLTQSKANPDYLNRILLPAGKDETTIDKLLSESDNINQKQATRLEDTLELLYEVDFLLATVGLQLDYKLEQGAYIPSRGPSESVLDDYLKHLEEEEESLTNRRFSE
jgi:proteasome lid subunit RPN8/RPN11